MYLIVFINQSTLIWARKCCKIGVSSRRIKGLQAFILHFPGSGCMQMGLTRHKSPLIQFPFSWLHSLSLSLSQMGLFCGEDVVSFKYRGAKATTLHTKNKKVFGCGQNTKVMQMPLRSIPKAENKRQRKRGSFTFLQQYQYYKNAFLLLPEYFCKESLSLNRGMIVLNNGLFYLRNCLLFRATLLPHKKLTGLI